MFTGIILAVGEVESMAIRGTQARIRVKTDSIWQEVRLGDSVAVAGVCLTVVHVAEGALEFDAVTTTLNRTRLHALKVGDRVNLEPALRLGDALGGHLVSGHVDGVGTVKAVLRKPGETRFRIGAPREVNDFIMIRGSVAVDGISLTVAETHGGGFEVAVIPHTLSATTLAATREGDAVNLECDMIGRWVARFVKDTGSDGGLTWDRLKEEGY